jgi:ATPase subunit of ABC transporter with duplicated ATPase domains
VTHDEDVLDEVATRIWHFSNGKVEDFKGTYEDFQQSAAQKAPPAKTTAQRAR